ncbi:MipA/OmpV family protein [Vibrio cholerae]|uniref:MipA/OmpV family protein n=1 Tax=Vibrio cholerae TaxID=666 RepID=UPI0012AEDB88|nr:MipA/OmpV family protein [Vibrio cholerae]
MNLSTDLGLINMFTRVSVLKPTVLTALVCLVWSSLGFANENYQSSWSLGIAAAVQDTGHTGTNYQEYIFPYVRYSGENLTIDITSVSYALLRNDFIKASIVGRLRFDGYRASDSDFLFGMKDRDSAFDAGLEVSYDTEWGTISASYVSDVSNKHKGNELQVSISKAYAFKKISILPYINVNRLDSKLVDYYYGVTKSEETNVRKAYVGEAANTISVGINSTFQMSDSYQFITGINFKVVGEEISDSPIVEGHNQLLLYVGWLYKL